MFFTGAADNELREQTGSFPATLRKDKTTHPIFLMWAGASGHVACPCSTKGHWRKFRCIQEGCRLEMKEHTLDRDSFLIERYPFTLPLDPPPVEAGPLLREGAGGVPDRPAGS